jgi:hypothetical protein
MEDLVAAGVVSRRVVSAHRTIMYHHGPPRRISPLRRPLAPTTRTPTATHRLARAHRAIIQGGHRDPGDLLVRPSACQLTRTARAHPAGTHEAAK